MAVPSGDGSSAEVFYLKADAPDNHSTFAATDAEQAAAAVREAGFRARELTFLAHGTAHDVYAFTDPSAGACVVKLWRGDSPARSVAVESAVSRALLAARVEHATVLHSDATGSASTPPFLVSKRASGVSLRSIDEDDNAVAGTLGPQAEALAAVHAVQAAGFGLVSPEPGDGAVQGACTNWAQYLSTRLEQHLELITRAELMTSSEAAVAEAAIVGEPYSIAGALLHGDCGPHNALWDGRRIILIDWEDAVVGDPLFDVAMWCTFAPERRWPPFLNQLGLAVDSLPRDFWRYYLRISLSKTVVRLRLGIADQPGRAPASLRIQRALAELGAS
jgi:aminoglycoside phosphotransferase (APT) family kinase protein